MGMGLRRISLVINNQGYRGERGGVVSCIMWVSRREKES